MDDHDTTQYCPTCNYDLFGLSQSRCPECGNEFDRLTLPVVKRSTHLARAPSRLLGLGAFVFLIVGAMLNKGTVETFLDIPSVLLAVIAPLALLVACFGIKRCWASLATIFARTPSLPTTQRAIAFFRLGAAFSLGCGFLASLIGLVLMLKNMDDPNAIGPGMAVAILSQLYAVVLALLALLAAAFLASRYQAHPYTTELEKVASQSVPTAAAATGIGVMYVLLCCFVMWLSL